MRLLKECCGKSACHCRLNLSSWLHTFKRPFSLMQSLQRLPWAPQFLGTICDTCSRNQSLARLDDVYMSSCTIPKLACSPPRTLIMPQTVCKAHVTRCIQTSQRDIWIILSILREQTRNSKMTDNPIFAAGARQHTSDFSRHRHVDMSNSRSHKSRESWTLGLQSFFHLAPIKCFTLFASASPFWQLYEIFWGFCVVSFYLRIKMAWI